MFKEPTRKGWSTLAKGVAAGELLVVIVAYMQYRKMNRSNDYRFQMYKSYPTILNTYYYIGEKFGGLKTRETDKEYFNMRLGIGKFSK